MPLLGLTTAQAKYAKWLLREAAYAVPSGLAWLTSELVANSEAPTNLEWRRFVLSWTRTTPTGLREDAAQFKLDLVNITSDELDVSWTSGDYASVAAAYSTFVTALASRMGSHQDMQYLRAYRMQFNPVQDVARPFAETGPPTYLLDYGVQPGTAASILPFQVAPAITLRTAWAKHWGRAYMPTPGTAHLDSSGRLTSSYTTGIGTAFKALLGTLHDAGFYPVVPVGQLNKNPFHALLAPTAVVVDDVPDIQRRRRAKQPAFRSVA